MVSQVVAKQLHLSTQEFDSYSSNPISYMEMCEVGGGVKFKWSSSAVQYIHLTAECSKQTCFGFFFS